MAYTKQTWVARAGSLLNRFTKSNETLTSVDLDFAGTITEGTEFTADRMNHIEDGIFDHDALTTAHGAVSANTASKMMVRDSSGRAQVSDPSAAQDILTKNWFDLYGQKRQKNIILAANTTQSGWYELLKFSGFASTLIRVSGAISSGNFLAEYLISKDNTGGTGAVSIKQLSASGDATNAPTYIGQIYSSPYTYVYVYFPSDPNVQIYVEVCGLNSDMPVGLASFSPSGTEFYSGSLSSVTSRSLINYGECTDADRLGGKQQAAAVGSLSATVGEVPSLTYIATGPSTLSSMESGESRHVYNTGSTGTYTLPSGSIFNIVTYYGSVAVTLIQPGGGTFGIDAGRSAIITRTA